MISLLIRAKSVDCGLELHASDAMRQVEWRIRLASGTTLHTFRMNVLEIDASRPVASFHRVRSPEDEHLRFAMNGEVG
jgi:hypothetical protein